MERCIPLLSGTGHFSDVFSHRQLREQPIAGVLSEKSIQYLPEKHENILRCLKKQRNLVVSLQQNTVACWIVTCIFLKVDENVLAAPADVFQKMQQARRIVLMRNLVEN
ncbi:MAG: uncharacterized protein A8A55_2620 [Amphiamblys sp. WSBS2006]|nr:MAG: uncharacterized protein A8A55_2620 [Amphiamblys sp. WSBS2006]